ncbi:MAG: hypothetical protein ACYTGP_06895 [Planctomycetota bacterium]|jgi:hypothetical protein
MSRVLRPFVITALLALPACTADLSFSDRAGHEAVTAARAERADGGPLAVDWRPAEFGELVEREGPVGSEGAATRATIPTGPAVTGRVEELLDAMVGVDARSPRRLLIEVLEADTGYRYATGFPTSRHIDLARCTVVARLELDGERWESSFSAEVRKSARVRGTALVERAWDEVALDIATSAASRAAALGPVAGRPAPVTAAPALSRPAAPGDGLDTVIAAWPRLPESVRNRILGIIEGAALSGESD